VKIDVSSIISLEHIPMEPLKVKVDVWSIDREPPCFLYAVKRVLKVIEEDVWSVDRETPCFLYTVLRI
jgi:hypothetical protein